MRKHSTFNIKPRFLFGYLPSNTGPAFSSSFTNGTAPSNLTFSRASSATYIASNGTRQVATTNTPRFDYNPVTYQINGMLVEEQRTNYLLNSTAPVTQTVSLPTGTFVLWCEGTGSVASVANTAVGTGFGSASGGALATYGTPNRFTLTTAGTVDFTITGTVTAFQVEVGSNPSTLIITTSAAGTRSADIANLLAVPYNISAGTLITSSMLMFTPSGTLNKVVTMTNPAGTELDLVDMYYTSTVRQSTVKSGNIAVASLAQVTAPSGNIIYKLATAMQQDDYALAINGSVVATDTSGAMPADTLSSISVGRRSVINTSQFLNGWIRQVDYYNTRLPNTSLTSLTTPDPIQPLMSVAAENRIPYSSESQSVTNYITRVSYYVGGGDVSQFVLNNAANELGSAGNGTIALPNDFTITSAAIEKDGASFSVPVYFGGSRSVTVTAGSFDINSDPVYPGAFGLTKFTRGEKYWVRMAITVPTTAGKLPFNAKSNIPTGTSYWWYDPAVTTITNGVDGFGLITRTGTFPFVRSAGYNPILLGRFIDPSIKSYIGMGDSIHFGTGDVAATFPENGYGIFQRAMTAGDGVTAPLAGLNLNRFGATATSFDNAWVRSYLKYGNVLVEELGTNDIGTGAVNITTIETNIMARWADFKTATPAGKIVRTYMLPRTNTTDSYLTIANQSYQTNWAPGGFSQQLNVWMDSKKTDGTINAVVQTSSVADGTDPFKWKVDGSTTFYETIDGTHPSGRAHLARGAEVRVVLLTV